jgi:anti-sigma factor RsiW
MSDGHPGVTELLGAWALDACSVEEAAGVEGHLAGCPACRAEAARLGRAVAGLAATVASAPPGRLRGAVLAAAFWRLRAIGADLVDAAQGDVRDG